MATGGQFDWPPAGIFVAAYGQFFMAANTPAPSQGEPMQTRILRGPHADPFPRGGGRP
jgi:hypothetical protein